MRRAGRLAALFVTLAAVLATAAPLGGQCLRSAGTVQLEPGDKAPPFKLRGSDGQSHSLARLKGRTVVLAWFARAFSAG